MKWLSVLPAAPFAAPVALIVRDVALGFAGFGLVLFVAGWLRGRTRRT